MREGQGSALDPLGPGAPDPHLRCAAFPRILAKPLIALDYWLHRFPDDALLGARGRALLHAHQHWRRAQR
jgi:hypothetical protein